jgi:hypothetical protein
MPEDEAKRAVAMVLEVAIQAEIIEHHVLDMWERDAAIYHRRGVGALPSALSTGFSVSRATIFLRLRLHAKRRRAALRVRDGHFEMAG